MGIEGLREKPNSLLLKAGIAVTCIRKVPLIYTSQERSCRVLRELQICDPASEERELGIYGGAVRDILAAGLKVRNRVGGKAVVGVLRLSSPTLGNLSG